MRNLFAAKQCYKSCWLVGWLLSSFHLLSFKNKSVFIPQIVRLAKFTTGYHVGFLSVSTIGFII